MDDKRMKPIHTVCAAAIAAAIAVAAVCLIISAYTIYGSGETPYTPESIGEQYARFALPLWVALGAVAAGILFDIFLPTPKNGKKNQADVLTRLAIMQKKLSAIGCGEDILREIERERRYRKITKAICALLCASAFIPTAIVLCDFKAFTVENLTPAILRTVFRLALGAVLSAVLILVRSLLDGKSAEREIAKTKIALSEGEKKAVAEAEKSFESKRAIVRLVLIGAACALILLGALSDGYYDVLQKAIRICTECIGLG